MIQLARAVVTGNHRRYMLELSAIHDTLHGYDAYTYKEDGRW